MLFVFEILVWFNWWFGYLLFVYLVVFVGYWFTWVCLSMFALFIIMVYCCLFGVVVIARCCLVCCLRCFGVCLMVVLYNSVVYFFLF